MVKYLVTFKNDMWPYDYSEVVEEVEAVSVEDAKNKVLTGDPYCTIVLVERK